MQLPLQPLPQRPAWLKSARSSWSSGIGCRMCMRCAIALMAVAKMVIPLRWKAGPGWSQGPFGALPKMFGPTSKNCWNEVWRCYRRQTLCQWEAHWKIWTQRAPNFMCRPHCTSWVATCFQWHAPLGFISTNFPPLQLTSIYLGVAAQGRRVFHHLNPHVEHARCQFLAWPFQCAERGDWCCFSYCFVSFSGGQFERSYFFKTLQARWVSFGIFLNLHTWVRPSMQ